MALFAGLALLLALAGIYATISYAVSRRTREIGIRMSLGARPGEVVRMMLRHGLSSVAAGGVIGTLAALGLSRFLEGQLYGVDALDPLTFVVVPLMFALAAVVGCYLPARKASAVDPVIALRQE